MKALYALALVAAPLLGMAQGTTNVGTVPADSKPLAEPKPLTAETLWKLGRVSLEAVSPDGSRAVYGVARYDVAANKGERNLFTVDTKSGIASALTETEGAETDAFFLRGGARVGYLYQGQLWTVGANGTDPKQHTQFPDGVSNLKVQEMKDGRLLVVFTVVQKLSKAPNEVHPEFPKADYKAYNDLLYRHWDHWTDNSFEHPAWLLLDPNATTPASAFTDLLDGLPYSSPLPPMGGSDAYAISPDGRYIAYVCKRQTGKEFALSTNSQIYLHDRESGATTELPGQPGYESLPAFSPDGSVLTYLSMPTDGFESDVNQLWALALRSGPGAGRNAVRLLDEEYIESYKWLNNNTLLYQYATQATQQIARVDFVPRPAGGIPSVKKATPLTSGDFNYGAFGAGGTTVVAERQDINRANELFVLSLGGGEAKALTHVNDAAYAGIAKSKVEKRWITTTDGKKMLTWVVLPPNFDEKKSYPALLYCQGGPQSAVSQFYSFRWNFQLMAANGYVVVAPNRRGVPGFGKEWNEAISGDWGGQAMKDYLSAIDSVAKEPYVNKEALGAVGASYGGYSVYMLAGIHENRFKALISHCGVFDLRSMYLTTEEMFFANHDIGGPYWAPAPSVSYDLHNPSNYVDRWNAPLLVIHGGRDFRVPESQGMMAYQAAQLRNVPSRFVYFPTEGHWILKPQNAMVWNTEFFGWLDQWLKKP
jgi:dipeptidyl aminopeptidase/acylaminoacyl peptidase